MRSLVEPSSKLRIEPVLRVSPCVKVIVPGELPGERMPPEEMVARPPMLPLPPNVAPLATETAVLASEPFTISEPAEMVVVPKRVKMPEPDLESEPERVPAKEVECCRRRW